MRATRSSFRSWSTTRTSCRGTSCASGRAPSSNGRRSPTTARSCSRSSRSCSRRGPGSWRSRICRTSLGTVVPIKEVVRLAHARGIPVLVDGSQARGASAGRRARPRLRFLLLHRPQALRPDRHRRALRQAGVAATPAALHGWRRDDPRRHRGPRHLRRTAASLRGGHAADRPGDRPCRVDRLCRDDRPRTDRRA